MMHSIGPLPLFLQVVTTVVSMAAMACGPTHASAQAPSTTAPATTQPSLPPPTTMPAVLPENEPQRSLAILEHRISESLLRAQFDSFGQIRRHLESLGPDGRWPDIDYTLDRKRVRSYSPVAHSGRVRSLAWAYVVDRDDNPFRADPRVLEAVRLALRDQLGREPTTEFSWDHDWFQTWIGGPWRLMDTVFLLRDVLPREEQLLYAAAVPYTFDCFKAGTRERILRGDGINTVWAAQPQLLKAILEENPDRIGEIYAIISTGVIRLVHGKAEGMHADAAFHQHGNQLYSAGYGRGWLGTALDVRRRLRDTVWYDASLSQEQVEFVTRTFLDGHRWMMFRGAFDWHASGREITRRGSTRAMSADALERDAADLPEIAEQLRSLAAHIRGGPSPVTGNRHFWLTDYMVHRGSDWFLSAKVLTRRTDGTETMNDENLLGHNLPLGGTNIMTRGDEFIDLYGNWDWSRIPGTTAELGVEVRSPHTFRGNNPFGGGVSDGQAGALAFAADYRDINVKKAYFFLDQLMVCLGADLTAAKPHPIVTSLNQTRFVEPVRVGLAGGVETVPLDGPPLRRPDVRFLHHDRVGYLLLEPATLQVQALTRTDSWRRISLSYRDENPAATTTNRVFSAWIDHGTSPSAARYAYAVLPGVSLDETAAAADTRAGIEVLRNDADVQAITRADGSITLAVFYSPARLAVAADAAIEAMQPSMVLLRRTHEGYRLFASDPLVASDELRFTLTSGTIRRNVSLKVETGDGSNRTVARDVPLNEPAP